MPKKGQRVHQRVTPATRAAIKKRVLELVAEGELNMDGIAQEAGCGRRTIVEWRQKDEKFALAFADAERQSVEYLESIVHRRAKDALTDHNDKWAHMMLMFRLKKLDPSYRENAKLEHTVAPGLAKSLAELAKAAEQDERLA